MNYPRIEWGKGKRFDFGKFLDQPLLRTSKNVEFDSIRTNAIFGANRIESRAFKHNLNTGYGYSQWKDQHNKTNYEVDNLFVRQTMIIQELLVNQMRASNGTQIIGSVAKLEQDGAINTGGSTWNFTFESNSSTANLQPFAVNDLIRAKRFTMPNDGSTPSTLYEVKATVTAISVGGDHAKITVTVDAGTPSGGMDFVRTGNTTDVSRQGLIVMSSDGQDSGGTATVPWIDVYNGLNTHAKFMDKDYVVVRLGRLDEITGGTNEFGLYGSVVHLSGSGGSGWGTVLEGNGAPAAPTFDPADYTNGTLYFDFTNQMYYLVVGGIWTLMAGGIGENGELGIPAIPVTGGNGLYASGDYLGFYDNGDWRGYWLNSGADAGDFFLKGANKTAMHWDYSTSSLFIGGTETADAYLVTSAGAGNIEFWDTAGVNVLGIGSNLDGGNNSGITLREKGFIYKYNTSNNAVSTVHSELYNQTTNYIGGISTLVSTISDGSTPGFSTANLVSGIKSMAYVTGAYNAVGGQFHGEGTTVGTIYGVHAHGESSGGGSDTWGGYFKGISPASAQGVEGRAEGANYTAGGTFTGFGTSAGGTNYGALCATIGTGSVNIAVYGNAANATTNWAGYFAVGNVNINNTLFFGSAADVNLYRQSSTKLKTDDTFVCNGFESAGGFFTGEVSFETQLRLKELGSAPTHAAGYGKLWAQQSDHASLYTQPMWTTDGDHDDMIMTVDLRTITGNPTAWTGRMVINTFDNDIKIYADGSWRTIASW